VEVNGDEMRRYEVSAADVGLPESPADAVGGGYPADNAEIARAILAGEAGPRADLVLLNAGAAIYAAGAAETLREGVDAARATIASGAATRTLDDYVRMSGELAPNAA
jgi:anthranilate phosphoribosyltransferase